MQKLCTEISQRCVGNPGNKLATRFFHDQLDKYGWHLTSQKFPAMDWYTTGASLSLHKNQFPVFASPYSRGYEGQAELAAAGDINQLKNGDFKNKILLLHGDLAQEQLMPKNFVFYNPPEHQHIIALLEKSKSQAIICATSKNAALAGGVYPFALIEDGDFDIPSVYMTAETGQRLLPHIGQQAHLKSQAQRIPSNGENIIGCKGGNQAPRIVVSAHIDAKKDTPGAIDNASGVTILLLLAELLQNYSGSKQIELVAFNGEDYYAAPGQMEYIRLNQNNFANIMLNINIDGAGYKQGKSAFSFFDLPGEITQKIKAVLKEHPDITEGPQWPQGDHSIFLQYGRPAVAVSSQWFIENIADQDITHTAKDNLDIIAYQKIVDIALAISKFIQKI
jgi:aminopeptidase YwaD